MSDYKITQAVSGTAIYLTLDKLVPETVRNRGPTIYDGIPISTEVEYEKTALILSTNLISAFLVEPLIMKVLTRLTPYKIIREIEEALITTTANSLALILREYRLTTLEAVKYFVSAYSAQMLAPAVHDFINEFEGRKITRHHHYNHESENHKHVSYSHKNMHHHHAHSHK